MTNKDTLLYHIDEADTTAHVILDAMTEADAADAERLRFVRRLLRQAYDAAKQIHY